MKKINVILGSTRNGRNGGKVAAWVMVEIAKLESSDVSFELIDLLDWKLPFVEYHMPPLMGEYPEGIVTEWAKKMAEADGYLIITPEYNHGYPAVLKNALDLINKEWNNKPVAFVSYGAGSGGIRAVEQLIQVVVELRMAPLKDQVNIQNVWAAFDEAGNIINEAHTSQLQATLSAIKARV